MPRIHPTALVAAGAQLADDVDIGPFCTIGPDAMLETGVRIVSHSVVDGHTTLRQGCTVWPFASVGLQTQDLKYRGGVSFTELGAGTTVREFVTIHAATAEGGVTRVGAGCHVMAYAHIAHDCQVGDGVILSNCAQLAGHVVIEDRAIVSAMAGVHQFGRVGRLSFVGAYCKVTQDVPPFMLVDGVPARVPSINAVGLKRAGISEEAQRALKNAHRLLYRSDLATSEALRQIEEAVELVDEVRHLLAFVRASERGIVK